MGVERIGKSKDLAFSLKREIEGCSAAFKEIRDQRRTN